MFNKGNTFVLLFALFTHTVIQTNFYTSSSFYCQPKITDGDSKSENNDESDRSINIEEGDGAQEEQKNSEQNIESIEETESIDTKKTQAEQMGQSPEDNNQEETTIQEDQEIGDNQNKTDPIPFVILGLYVTGMSIGALITAYS